MKRGLKGDQARDGDDLAEVEESSPMKRGLKGVSAVALRQAVDC